MKIISSRNLTFTILFIVGILLTIISISNNPSSAQAQDAAQITQEILSQVTQEVVNTAENIASKDSVKIESTQNAPSSETSGKSFTGLNYDSLPWKSSVMFPESELNQIYTGLVGRSSDRPQVSTPDPNLDPQNQPPAPQQPPQQVSAPAFYLNSILFYDPENWTIWVNNRRIRKNTPLNTIEVAKITREYVEFFWKPINLNTISPNWTAKLIAISDKSDEKPIDPKTIGAPENVDLTESVSPSENQDNNNILEISLEENSSGTEAHETIPDFQEIKLGEELPVNPNDAPLKLPPLYAQESFTFDISKLGKLLSVERDEIIARKEAEEAVRLAREAESIGVDEFDEEVSFFDAYKEREIPFLWEYRSKDGTILVDTINGVVKFRVGINQTFVSRTMEVVEGFVKSTILENTTQTATEELQTPDLERAVFDYNSQPGSQIPTQPLPQQ